MTSKAPKWVRKVLGPSKSESRLYRSGCAAGVVADAKNRLASGAKSTRREAERWATLLFDHFRSFAPRKINARLSL